MKSNLSLANDVDHHLIKSVFMTKEEVNALLKEDGFTDTTLQYFWQRLNYPEGSPVSISILIQNLASLATF